MTEGPDHAARRRRGLAAAAAKGASSLLVSDPVDVFYLTGFTGSNGSTLLAPGESVLITDARYAEQAEQQCRDITVVIDRDTAGAALRRARDTAALPTAVAGDQVTINEYTTLTGIAGDANLLVTQGVIAGLRRCKDAYERRCIAEACRLVSAAVDALVATIAVGQTEREVAIRLERLMVDLGADAVGFDSIVAAGANSAVPHHAPTDAVLRRGDLLKIDAGARYRGYHSDMTRTFVVGAEPTPRQRELHSAVSAAAASARGLLAPAVPAKAPDAAARRELGGLGQYFTHGLGHGVGLQIHEAPLLAARSADTIGRADVLTVEPGVYLSGFGGVRIEDTLLVTETGARSLTTTQRELVRVG